MDVAQADARLYVARVESKANIADEPSRLKFDTLNDLNALFVEPRLPPWAFDVWKWP
jgi:hypothetical protein